MNKKHLFLIFGVLSIFTSGLFAGDWNSRPKRIVGTPSPLNNKLPYTVMTQQVDGRWQYSGLFTPGDKLGFSFLVNTNLVSTNFMAELIGMRNLSVSDGTQGRTYFLTNNGIIKVTEGSPADRRMLVEFNWENTPDPPTGILADLESIASGRCKINWSSPRALDLIGYNIYLSNQYFPDYRKANLTVITGNNFTLTNLIPGSINSIYLTSLDAYTNLPGNESVPSSVLRVVAESNVTVMFYVRKKREEISDAIYVGGSIAPLDWGLNAKMQYLYNDIWFYKGKFPAGTVLQYKYNNSRISWEGDFSTSSGNRELTVRNVSGNGTMILNDVWGLEDGFRTPPSPPMGLLAVASNSNVSLSWDAHPSLDFKEFRLYRSPQTTNFFSFVASTPFSFYRDAGLINDKTYFYRLTAVDMNGLESIPTAPVSVVPSVDPVPVAPRGLAAVTSNSAVKLSWKLNPENDVVAYLVWKSLQKYSAFTSLAVISNSSAYKDLAVANGTTYYYKIQAIDLAGQTNEGYSEVVNAVPSALFPPSKPATPVVTWVSNETVVLGWKSNPESDIIGYEVYYKSENGAVSQPPLSTSSVSNVIVNGLMNGENYQFWIKAVNSSSNRSDSSDMVQCTPVPSVSGLSANPSGNETGAVVLDWDSTSKAGSLGFPVSYIIKYSTNASLSWDSFRDANLFAVMDASGIGSSEDFKVTDLGTDSPGHWFYVAAVYGDEEAVSVARPVYSVSAQLLDKRSMIVYRKKGEGITVEIPPDTLPVDVTAVAIHTKQDLVKEREESLLNDVSLASASFEAEPSVKHLDQDDYFLIEFLNAGNRRVDVKGRINNDFFVSLPFHDLDHNGFVDETESSTPVASLNLRTYRFDEEVKNWGFLKGSSVNLSSSVVRTSTSDSGVFMLGVRLAASNLEQVVIYPNPSYKPSFSNPVIFSKLPSGARLRIYDLAGSLVQDSLTADSQGLCKWDARNMSGSPVGSGLYFYYVEDGKNQPVRGKFAVVR